MKTLVIVESPAKAGTISKILGKDFDVTSSFGHVRDLAKDGKNNTGVDVTKKYTPHYEVPKDKSKVVKDLQTQAKKYDRVLLATDEDREGEAISWHLYEVLGLTKKNSKRITFTEITPEAIKNAVANPRDINIDLVNAQQARRILDRLVGFELTSLLWKKIRGKLSAGRVQSVAVRIVVDKEREIENFKPESYFKISGTFSPNAKSKKSDYFPAEYSKKVKTEATAQKILESLKKTHCSISSISVKPTKKSPPPPFTTSTLQQTASQKLGFSVSRTMSTAQRLYEAGHITYMRTDSVNLSGTAIKAMESYIKKEFGDNYHHPRQYKGKAKNTQEAHEAIRPTYVQKIGMGSNPDQQKLYNLIRARALASQMSPAETEKTTVLIKAETLKDGHFVAKGSVITFDGWIRAYSGTKFTSTDDIILPALEEGQDVVRHDVIALERKTKPPARYSEATLVKKLEELGIGRPSTYAPTIAKITSPTRGYITKETRDGEPVEYKRLTLHESKIVEDIQAETTGAQKNKLFASDMGKMVNDFLEKNFPDIMDYSFTAEVEDKLDEIALGNEDWVKTLDLYYKPFTKTIDKAMDKAERVTGERILGKDPESKRTLLVRMSKYGPVAQIGQPDELGEEEKPQYANLLQNQNLETITLEEALKLFELPKTIGQYKGKDVIIGRGRFGPYVKYDETFISIKGSDPFSITEKDAIIKVKEKLKFDEPITEYEGLPITKGVGRFGPYIKWDETFVSVPKSKYVLEEITPKQALDLLKDKIKKDKENTLHVWKNDKDEIVGKVIKGRWGPVLKLKGKRGFAALPKDDTGQKMDIKAIQKMTFEELKKKVK